MKRVAVHEVELAVHDQGSGPVLVFVHGFPLDHTMWKEQLAAFADSYRVIAPDLRGFGQSGVTPGEVTMEQFADDIARMLDELGVTEPIVFCGLSMGGYIAWQFVRKYPNRLRGLVLCDTRAASDTPELAEQRRRTANLVLEQGPEPIARAMMPKLFAESTTKRHPERVAATRAVVLRNAREGIAAALCGLASRPEASALLPQIRCPTLVMVGAHDGVSPPEEMRTFAAHIPNVRFTEIPDAGHMAPLENPETLNAHLAEFLRSLES